MKKTARGELTAFLSLIFLLLLSLVGAVLESASIQVMKNEKRADTSRAIESVFAEYQRELFERYRIFAIEGSYETGECSESDILNRLAYYGAENMELDIDEVRYLSDQSGRAFYEQAVQYEKEKTGMDKVEEIFEISGSWNKQSEKYDSYEEDQRETSKQLDQLLRENDEQLPEDNNPLNTISSLKSKSIWSVLLPEGFTLSEKEITKSNLVSQRNLRQGNWSETKELGGAVFFNLYLVEHFGSATGVKKDSALDYELEYLYAGKSSDKDNLEATLKSLCNIRFGINYLYLLGDAEKQAEARTMAAGMCTLLAVPGITEIVAQAILLAWAYGESMVDVKNLISGRKVALIKTKENWKVSLEKLIELDGEGEIGKDEVGGIPYETYLQMLIYTKSRQSLSMRALDLIEENLRKEYNFLRMDQCITGIKLKAKCNFRRGISYNFFTQYHYQ